MSEPDKTGAKTGTPDKGALVPQPHGGAIRYGNVKGDPNIGRPRNEWKNKLREDRDAVLQSLRELLSKGEMSKREQIQYASLTLKYTEEKVDLPLINRLFAEVEEQIDDHRLTQSIKAAWAKILAEAALG